MKNLAAFQSLIAQPQNIVVVTHFKPDGDALGSSLGLCGYLRKKGHQVQVITPSDYPDFLSWMPGNEDVLAVTKKPATLAKALSIIAAADVIFCVDFSVLQRIYDLAEPVRESRAVKVVIDHHLEPELFYSFEHWDTKSASTAGLIFELIEEMGDLNLIDSGIANCLYSGIMTDTGGFRHNNTRHKEFLIAGKLVEFGANPHEVAKRIYDSNTLERLRLTGFVLSQKLNVIPEYNTAYMTLSHHELKEFGAQTGDTEGLVNYGLSIQGIKLAVLMYDRKEEIKLSFRSLGDFPADEMARKYFNGGGHRNAAGGQSKRSLEETLSQFLEILPEYKEALLKKTD